MNKYVLVAVVAVCALALQALAVPVDPAHTCPCQLRGGSDGCTCTQSVVRPPRPVKIEPQGPRILCHKIPGVDPLTPIGDTCSCDHTYVEPAEVPRLHCPTCQKRYRRPHGDYETLPEVLESDGSRIHYVDVNVPAPPPVDPVSLSLAFGLAQQRGLAVREETLAFGPRQLPKDGVFRKIVPNVPEEGLVTFDKQIVELKIPRTYGCGRAQLEAEEEQALLEAQQAELEAEDDTIGGVGLHPRLLTYPEVGYVPVNRPSPQFVLETGDDVADEMAREVYVVPEGAETFSAQIPHYRRPGSVVITGDNEVEVLGGGDERLGVYGLDADAHDADYSSGEQSPSVSAYPGLLGKLYKTATGCGCNY